jgi:large subunit ribosomal protein L19
MSEDKKEVKAAEAQDKKVTEPEENKNEQKEKTKASKAKQEESVKAKAKAEEKAETEEKSEAKAEQEPKEEVKEKTKAEPKTKKEAKKKAEAEPEPETEEKPEEKVETKEEEPAKKETLGNLNFFSDVRKDLPQIKPGDVVRVSYRVIEGGKERTQVFEGIVIAMKRSGIARTITVRKTSFGIAVERIFPLNSKLVQKIEIKKRSRVRRAKLYYLRNLKGRAARLKELR